MINLLIGAPGGGKSYEAVVYHILAALKRGRKVITNLPLVVSEFDLLDPDYSDLIELREKTLAVAPVAVESQGNAFMGLIHQARVSKFVDRPFANVEDYQSEWRNSEGMGPLYVIDECHFVLPRVGSQRAVEEWFSMHRHFNADVLLITQSSGKISTAIRDLVQVCYKVRKAIAFGKTDSYIRKVLDGVGGGEVAVSERKYKPQFFKLYRSHTQGVSLDEAAPDDVKPFIVKFRRMTWIVLAVAVVYCGSLASSFYFGKPAQKMVQVKSASGAVVSVPLEGIESPLGVLPPVRVASAPVRHVSAPAVVVNEIPEPYENKSFHVTGHMKMGDRLVHMFSVSQNGLTVSNVSDADLVRTGYRWVPLTDCAGVLYWQAKAIAVTCDVPQISMGNGMPPTTSGNMAPVPVAPIPQPSTVAVLADKKPVAPSTPGDLDALASMRMGKRLVSAF
jgi:zona occludens toxin